MKNALSIDVEDYFQVSAFEGAIARSQWPRQPLRVARNVARLLALLEQHQVKATFFTLGWVARREPAVVRDIVAAGHELASHGFDHFRASAQTEQAFYRDIAAARSLLEDVGGVAVRGYRAPSFSLGPRTPWAHEAIARAGYRYSSSVYPVRHDHYGVPDAPRFAHTAHASLIEIPVASVRVWSRNWPAGGGGFFRLLPYAVSAWMIRRINAEGRPAVFYLHPWELDPAQPRVGHAPLKSQLRHYLNLSRTEPRLARLLSAFEWARIDTVYPEVMQ